MRLFQEEGKCHILPPISRSPNFDGHSLSFKKARLLPSKSITATRPSSFVGAFNTPNKKQRGQMHPKEGQTDSGDDDSTVMKS